jgi:hypothetical protein
MGHDEIVRQKEMGNRVAIKKDIRSTKQRDT